MIHLALEPAIGRCDDAHVDLARPGLSQPADLASLDGAQQLGLHLERQLADLVEEDRSAVGRLEGARAVLIGAGEGAARVAEELALDEARRDRTAVDQHEGLAGTRAVSDDLGRDELLAGAALALDEDVRVGLAHSLDDVEEPLHRLRPPLQGAERRAVPGDRARGEGQLADAQRGAADGDRGLRHAQLGLLHADAAEHRAVERAVVGHGPARALAFDAEVEPGHAWIVDDQIVARVRAHAEAVLLDHDLATGARARLLLEDDVKARDRDRVAARGDGALPASVRLSLGVHDPGRG